MAAGDIHISVVPPTSAVAPYTYTNEYGNTVTSTEKSIAGNPDMLEIYINTTKNAIGASGSTLEQILDGRNRLILVLKEA